MIQIHLQIIGILLMGLASLHIGFPKYFSWNKELTTLSLVNRQMMTVHACFIALTVFLMGLLCLTGSHDLVQTEFGKKIALGLGLFWVIRLFFQFFVYSSKLWKGKTFETIMHILFSFLWLYFSLVFLIIYFK